MNQMLGRTQIQDTTRVLARSLTWSGSKQTYFTARLLVDRDLVEDCFRAYAYFRWADDIVDADDSPASSMGERLAFIRRQKTLVDRLYQGDSPQELAPEEEMVATLIRHDLDRNCGLTSFMYNFLAILEFDAGRRGRPISRQELTWYSNCLAKAVTDGIHYFIGHNHPAPTAENRYLAVFGAHITHMLRDMVADMADGYLNIPVEYMAVHGIQELEVASPAFSKWVQGRVELARNCLKAGQHYINGLGVLRRKIAGIWYCARYDRILDAIERDRYILRAEYRRTVLAWLRIGWLGLAVTIRHLVRHASGWRAVMHIFSGRISELRKHLSSPKPRKKATYEN